MALLVLTRLKTATNV